MFGYARTQNRAQTSICETRKREKGIKPKRTFHILAEIYHDKSWKESISLGKQFCVAMVNRKMHFKTLILITWCIFSNYSSRTLMIKLKKISDPRCFISEKLNKKPRQLRNSKWSGSTADTMGWATFGFHNLFPLFWKRPEASKQHTSLSVWEESFVIIVWYTSNTTLIFEVGKLTTKIILPKVKWNLSLQNNCFYLFHYTW